MTDEIRLPAHTGRHVPPAITTGTRCLETYVIEGLPGSGVTGINGRSRA